MAPLARRPLSQRVARKLYYSSPNDLVELAGKRYRLLAKRRRKPPPLTLEFFESGRYEELMSRHVPCDGNYGLHEAETATKSFLFRAFEVDDVLRAFCWRGVQENLDLILRRFDQASRPVIDLGGAASPFGLGSVVVDLLPYDVDGNPVPYRTLSELPSPVDVIVSSHTLEHIPDLEAELERIRDYLVSGGTLLAHIPAFTCVRWRAGTHSHASFGDHAWTFGLSNTANVPQGLVNYVEIDRLLARHFELESAVYCGDDSIFVVCRRR
jgi:hypothetical protein